MTLPLDLPAQPAPDDLDRYAATLTKKEQRPDRYLPIVLETAAKALAPVLIQWLRQDGDDATEAEVVPVLVEILDDRMEDGYELAHALDSKGWSPDARLVEILDEAAMHVSNAHSRLIKGWVKAHGITLDLPIGTPVTTRHGEGEVTVHHPETARYTVFMASEGHVRSGLGTHGYVVDAEDVERLNAGVGYVP